MYKKLCLLFCALGLMIVTLCPIFAVKDTLSLHLVEKNTPYIVGNIVLNEPYDFYVVTGSHDELNITIPATMNNLPILAIADAAFSENTITNLDLSQAQHLKIIGDFAFKDAHSLTGSLLVPKNILIIGQSAFRGTKINHLSFAENSSLSEIKPYAFAATDSLSGIINFPNSLKSLGDFAFINSTIEGLTFGNQLESIGRYAFDNNPRLAGDLILNAPLKTIGNHAFRGNKFVGIDLVHTLLETIDPHTFSQSPTLEYVKLPKTLKVLDANGFAGNANIKSLTFVGTKPISIDKTAFDDVLNLETVFVANDDLFDYYRQFNFMHDAVYDTLSFTLSFETDGGTLVDTLITASDTLVTAPLSPTKAGYVFDGWYLNDDYVTRFDLLNG